MQLSSLRSLRHVQSPCPLRRNSFQPQIQPKTAMKWHLRATSGDESSETSTSASPSTPSPGSDDDDLLIEQQMAKRRPKPKTPKPAPGSYKVISATRDQVYSGGPLTAVQKFENGAVSFLAFLFFVILAEGVFLAASGFMSEEVDQFAQDVVYPAFSPTLIFFLVCSSLYGVWKTGGGRKEDGTS